VTTAALTALAWILLDAAALPTWASVVLNGKSQRELRDLGLVTEARPPDRSVRARLNGAKRSRT